MISDGDISGTKAVDIIQQGLEQYAGAMEEMSKTFEGRTSTLSDTMAEIYNAGGETYNQSRTEAMALEIETYGGALGEAMKEAYAAIGDGQAALENLGEAYTRDALSAVLQGGALTQEWMRQRLLSWLNSAGNTNLLWQITKPAMRPPA